jgi:electron transfer flavoprotein alpha subunit/NAD-dependent dihydropyrimidine dehydrogenase PreA subunit
MINVDKAKCTGCRLCARECPFNAIRFTGKYPEVTEKCRVCGACVRVCPVKALSLKTVEKKVEGVWRGVLVFGEQRDGTVIPVVYELLGKARELADNMGEDVSCVLLGGKVKNPRELIEYGADMIYLFEHKGLEKFNSEVYANILAEFAREIKPNIFLIGATNKGRELAPRISSRLGAGLTADCTFLEIDKKGLLVQTRPAFGGNIMASIISPHARPQMATVRYKVMDKIVPGKRKGKLIKRLVDEKLLESKTEVVGERMLPAEEDIVNADVIVAGGRGVGRKEGFDMLHDLACLLEGCVGASRPAVEAAWLDYPCQVGLSGKVVKPELYVACGISGAVQHLAGMESSGVVVAVNKDENAPIFEVADFGVVGDVNEVMPEVIREIKRRRAK